jgi:hypothetical protein
MAIKEFQVGPLNYWEEGYFDGDYTLPNVSKAFLECDIDNIKGGRVVTGLYYLDNYIDGTYYHDNSIRAFMTVEAMVVQEATVGLQGYYSEGYYTNGYYEQRGSFFVLTAELEIVGEDVFASGEWSSLFTMDITVSKTASAESTMSAEFTQVAYGARERDIDLFAFSEAAIAIQIEVTRTTNILLTSVFDIATDGRRFRDITSDDEAVFSIDVVNQRSREFNLETQAAFSFAADNTRLKLYSSDLTEQSALTCTISHIEGVDIIQQNFASMDIVAEKTVVGIAVLESVSSINFIGGLLIPAASAIRAHASVFVSRNLGRPRNVNISAAGQPFNDVTKKFGTHSYSIPFSTISFPYVVIPNLTDDWVLEGWVYAFNNTNPGYNNVEFRNHGVTIGFGEDPGSTALRLRAYIESTTGEFYFFQKNTTGVYSRNIWYHMAAVKSGSTISFYINGSRYATVTAPSEYLSAPFRITRGNLTGDNIDEVHFIIGNTMGYNANNSTIVVPTVARDNFPTYTQFLYHFDGNGNDDITPTAITQSANANVNAITTISARLLGTQTATAPLTATASVVSAANVDRGADITVNNFATLSADATHIKSLASDIDSEFSQQTTADYIFGANADLTVDSQTAVDSERTRSFEALTDAVGVIVAVTAKVGAFFINAETETIFAVDANKTTDVISTLTVDINTSILGEKYGSLEATVDSEFTLDSSANRTRDTEVSLNTTADINIESSNTLDFLADLDSQFMLMADASGGTIRATLVAESFANLTAQAQSTLSAQGSLNSLFTVSADTEDSLTVRIVSDMFSNGSVTADNSRLRDNIIVTESVASNLVVVVKTTDADIALTSTLELSAEANKTVGYTAELATDVSVSTLGSLTRTTSVELETQFDVSATGRKDSEAAADLFSSTTLSAIGVKGTEILLQAFTNAGLTLDANVIREVAVEESATTELTAEFDRTRSTAIQLLAFSAQLTVGGITADAVAIQLGTFTLSAQIGVLHLQEYVYKIPGETRYYKISSETRVKSIAGETRIYTIRR